MLLKDCTQIYTLGPQGTFSDEAAQKVLKAGVSVTYTGTFAEALAKVTENLGSAAVVPVENSVAGTVAQVQAASKQGMLGVKVGKNWILDKTDLDPIPKKRGNPNFHLESYQETLKEQRREERIAADELEKAIEKKPEKPSTGGIMMGRRRKS